MQGLGRKTILLALCALVSATGAASASAYPEFCSPTQPARDFGLSRLPPVREVPRSGQLPFARPNVNVYGSESHVVTEPSGFGYGFSEENFEGTVRLEWTVTAQMWLLGRRGAPVREVDSETLYIGELDAGEQPYIHVDPLGRRGFYRADFQFADKNGLRLGSYSAYVKVARPFWKARLKLDRRFYEPGDRVFSRAANLGTRTMTYGESFAVQRREGDGWVPAPDLTPNGSLLWLGVGRPGSPGICSRAELPGDVAPGRYRIVKEVTELIPGHRDPVHHLVAPFVVRG
jgi:hypothetical protein